MSSQFRDTKKGQIFGIPGEFTVGSGEHKIRAKYILTKLRPGDDGLWENDLASRMVPWREVFQLKDLSFDELLQRDLDDSRVATKLIPYLLGNGGQDARFFPPIVAIIVPRNADKTGIENFYPQPATPGKDLFGELFDVLPVEIDGKVMDEIPLSQIKYNQTKCAFVIADGQHRAMALLAIQRQLNKSWADNPFAYYYDHIQVTKEMVASIELPVSIVYFPDLFDGNPALGGKRINLRTICREIFLIVNRSAKAVSDTRQLLLDDEDFGAIMMRQTLQSIKKRKSEQTGQIKIHSVSYGDSDEEDGGTVATGAFQLSTAVALHKMHGLMSFANPTSLRWLGAAEVKFASTRGFISRAPELLIGVPKFTVNSIAQKSAKSIPPDQVDLIVENLGQLNDTVFFELFDHFRPFQVHTSQMEALRTTLSSTTNRSDAVQNQCHNLIFDGSGTRNVFEAHLQRLHDMQQENELDENSKLQLNHHEAVAKALTAREREFKRSRAAKLANIDEQQFFTIATPEDQKILEEWSQRIYTTLSTQAFQIGYVMAVLSTIFVFEDERLLYSDRLELTKFISQLFVIALDKTFSPDNETKHRTLAGVVMAPRSSAFDNSKPGLRGMLSERVSDINERIWSFFRYALLELLFSEQASAAVAAHINQNGNKWAQKFADKLPHLAESLIRMRIEQTEKIEDAYLKQADFLQVLMQETAIANAKERSSDEIADLRRKLEDDRRTLARKRVSEHLNASVGPMLTAKEMVERIKNGGKKVVPGKVKK
ncbi:MAG: hypothetical protein IPJ49_03775 [Candidatus Obscuribacter sp.]|nr:hypothetical protein [Candidatus Obscuribacter sp.]